jgi:hypothetical protein
VQARNKSTHSVLASPDTVAPVSAEANCKNCHVLTLDGGNGLATTGAISPIKTSMDDPQVTTVPLAADVEWAADINFLTLCDDDQGTTCPLSTAIRLTPMVSPRTP